MAATCPSCGAASTTSDYCDTCGAALTPAGPTGTVTADTQPSAAAPPDTPCPNCGATRTPDDAFCEGCGLDFATGQVPVAPEPQPAPAGGPSDWTAVIEADRAFYDSNDAEGSTPIPFPDALGVRSLPLSGDEVVIGRRSEAKGFFPDIDLSSPVPDPGVSHRHAVLRRQADGTWALLDEMSTNGTWINGADKPVEKGVLTALHDGDRINLGSFSRITIVHADKSTP